jgi:hypothetical protein
MCFSPVTHQASATKKLMYWWAPPYALLIQYRSQFHIDYTQLTVIHTWMWAKETWCHCSLLLQNPWNFSTRLGWDRMKFDGIQRICYPSLILVDKFRDGKEREVKNWMTIAFLTYCSSPCAVSRLSRLTLSCLVLTSVRLKNIKCRIRTSNKWIVFKLRISHSELITMWTMVRWWSYFFLSIGEPLAATIGLIGYHEILSRDSLANNVKSSHASYAVSSKRWLALAYRNRIDTN